MLKPGFICSVQSNRAELRKSAKEIVNLHLEESIELLTSHNKRESNNIFTNVFQEDEKWYFEEYAQIYRPMFDISYVHNVIFCL
jgi:hypothetical protein